MATDLPTTNGSGPHNDGESGSFEVKAGLARMLKGGVIMDVVNAEQVCAMTYTIPKFPGVSDCDMALLCA